MRTRISPYWATVVPLVALAAGAARWLLQGSGNIYTSLSRRYYLPDPDLGWRVVDDGPLWLGLELLAGMALAALAVAAGAWLIRRRERAAGPPWSGPRLGLWVVAALPLVAPLWAFATGLAPDGARDRLPMSASEAPRVAPAGIRGTLAGARAGTYRVASVEGSAITARIAAGGETFDTRFAGGLRGFVTLDPGDLRKPVIAEVGVDAASVDTGITTRSKHAREYLKAGQFPRIELALDELLAAQQGQGPGEVEFWARVRVTLMGDHHDIPVTGRVRVLDEAGRERLGLGADVLVLSGDFLLDIEETPLAPDAGDFDSTKIPINASLILALEAGGATSDEPEDN